MTLRSACQRVISDADLANCDCSRDKISPALTDSDINDILDAASDALANITGLPIGRCTTVYRPCRDYCHYWDCACGCTATGIPLPGVDPVVTGVKIDGATINPNTYAVLRTNGTPSLERFLLTGAPDAWPSAQNPRLPDTQVGTFSITVESGYYPDRIMRLAAAEIGCDILHSLAQERQVEDSASSATVYGETVSYTRFGDPTDQSTMTLAGLGQVRRFIASVGALMPAAIISNDLMRGWTLYQRES